MIQVPLVLVFLLGAPGYADNAKVPDPVSETRAPAAVQEPGALAAVVAPGPKRLKLNTGFGVTLVQGAKANVSAQLGYQLWSDRSFFAGPELSIAKSGDVLVPTLLVGAWNEWPVDGAPRLSLAAGALVGLALTSSMPDQSAVGATAFVDFALSQTLDESTTVRAQFRPGVLGNFFAFMMNFNVCFRL